MHTRVLCVSETVCIDVSHMFPGLPPGTLQATSYHYVCLVSVQGSGFQPVGVKPTLSQEGHLRPSENTDNYTMIYNSKITVMK